MKKKLTAQLHPLEQKLVKFLFGKEHTQAVYAKFLLGLSGGADSMSLFYMLLKVRSLIPFSFEVAHIDHKWRIESSEEARILKTLCTEHKVPFHLLELNPQALGPGNLENICRNKRLSFFQELSKKYQYTAVLLAHHGDDQVETVLKRALEGAFLTKLKGIEMKIIWEKVPLWRPFLDTPKQQLLAYLSEKNLSYFEDSTNLDIRFNRGRMRQLIVPTLTEQFQKNIFPGLHRIAENALELEGFLNEQIVGMYQTFSAKWGNWYCFCEKFLSAHLFLIKYGVRKAFEEEQIALPQQMVEEISRALQQKIGHKSFYFEKNTVEVDRGHLFLIKIPFKDISEEEQVVLYPGNIVRCGNWEIYLSDQTSEKTDVETLSSWKNLLCTEGVYKVPKKEFYLLQIPHSKIRFQRKVLGDFFTDCKVPHFLRKVVPIVCDSQKNIQLECLTGCKSSFTESSTLFYILRIKYVL